MGCIWRGDQLKGPARKAAMDGLEELMRTVIMPDSDAHCPVDTGTMRGTHTVQRNDGEGAVVGGYGGGAAAAYTRRQHEDVSLHHKVGEAKWHEHSFNRHKGEAPEYMAKHVDKVLR